MKPISDQAYYQANEIASKLREGIWPAWKLLGTADNQSVLNQAKEFADAGDVVLAVWSSPDPREAGHVALIGPGPLTPSDKDHWNMQTPVSASFSIGEPRKAYLGKPLACAFGADKKRNVQIWVHFGLPPAPPTGLTATVQ